MKCIECQRPARCILGTDIPSDHCSNECVAVTWERYRAASSYCIGEITVRDIDEKLSTTGLDVESLAGAEA